MRSLRVPAIVLLCAATAFSSVIPNEADHKSSNDRAREKDLSDQQHFDNEVHNAEYDHEAFLGDEANSFNDLSPEESKDKLGLIYDKIDRDNDGFVSEDELIEWIKHVQNRYIEKDTARQWDEHKIEGDLLDWKAYKQRTYGFEDVEDSEMDGDSYDYKDMVRRDKRRWELADGDKDGKLTRTEFSHFLHPEEQEHMRAVVIDETLEDIDKDKDGRISLEEYIEDLYDTDDDEEEFEPEWVKEERDDFETARDKNGDGFMDRDEITEWIYPAEEQNYAVEEAKHLLLNADDDDMWPQEEDEEPDWVKSEREQFTEFRDKNKDGFMDTKEVQDWIIPPDYDHSEAEGKHLIFEADANRDGKLTKEEVLNKYDLFVGSQATDFGEALLRHDEF